MFRPIHGRRGACRSSLTAREGGRIGIEITPPRPRIRVTEQAGRPLCVGEMMGWAPKMLPKTHLLYIDRSPFERCLQVDFRSSELVVPPKMMPRSPFRLVVIVSLGKIARCGAGPSHPNWMADWSSIRTAAVLSLSPLVPALSARPQLPVRLPHFPGPSAAGHR